MKIDRLVKRGAEEEARKQGVSLEFASGGKHPAMIISFGDQSRRTPIAGTPRSGVHNQRDWVRQAVRRYARELQCQI